LENGEIVGGVGGGLCGREAFLQQKSHLNQFRMATKKRAMRLGGDFRDCRVEGEEKGAEEGRGDGCKALGGLVEEIGSSITEEKYNF
jgi:hypothetical protein